MTTFMEPLSKTVSISFQNDEICHFVVGLLEHTECQRCEVEHLCGHFAGSILL